MHTLAGSAFAQALLDDSHARTLKGIRGCVAQTTSSLFPSGPRTPGISNGLCFVGSVMTNDYNRNGALLNGHPVTAWQIRGAHAT